MMKLDAWRSSLGAYKEQLKIINVSLI